MEVEEQSSELMTTILLRKSEIQLSLRYLEKEKNESEIQFP